MNAHEISRMQSSWSEESTCKGGAVTYWSHQNAIWRKNPFEPKRRPQGKAYLLHKIIFVLTTGCCNHGTFGYSHAPLINPLSGFALWELEKPNKTRDIFKEIGAYRRLSQSSWTFLAILTPSNFSCKSPAGPFSTNSPGVENKTISEWQAWNVAMSHQNGNLASKWNAKQINKGWLWECIVL